MKLSVIPIELTDANAAIAAWHRHHQPCIGHRFSIGVVDEAGVLHGAAVVGRPVARLAGDPSQVLEVTRLVSNGTRNVCSMLYSAAARAGRELGFLRIHTYILADEETGVSLKASGWTCEGIAGGGQLGSKQAEPQDRSAYGQEVAVGQRIEPAPPLVVVASQNKRLQPRPI